MSTAAVCQQVEPRKSASLRAMTMFGFIAAMTFSAGGSAPTPLYRHYQDAMSLSSAMLTVVFSAYVVSLLAALLTVGSLSDYVGRRPVILSALVLNMLAMGLFIVADTPAVLIMARVVQGFATGIATTTLGAAILDADRARGPLFNSITAFAGLTVGSLASGALVSYAPHPAQLVYLLLLAASVMEVLVLWHMPETAAAKSGAWASLRPHMRVPAQARRKLALVTPVNIATWALGGFYFSLMPSLVRVATGLTLPIVGGGVVAALTLSATIAVVALRHMTPSRLLMLGTSTFAIGVAATLGGAATGFASLLFFGTVLAGLGFGAAFSGTIRTILPLAGANERAGLLSAFYVESYIAFSVPAVLVGLLVPVVGLPPLTYAYGATIIALAAASLIANERARRSEHRHG